MKQRGTTLCLKKVRGATGKKGMESTLRTKILMSPGGQIGRVREKGSKLKA